MEIRADFSERAVVYTPDLVWSPSPLPGVERRMLEHGDYPAGTWIRSPHASVHRPFSNEGCLIYVKVGHLPPSPSLSS